MQVIGGQAKGHRLKTPVGDHVRPTPAKVKEALFSILAGRVIGTRFLDLFAGTGGIGIEALSRGADYVDFVEEHPASIKALVKNLNSCGFASHAHIHHQNVITSLCTTLLNDTFDIIYADPPYHTGILEELLPLLGQGDMIKSFGIVIVEHFHKNKLPEQIGLLNCFRTNRYGDTVLSFYNRSA